MRCYNGCPDSELKAYLNEIQSAKDMLKKVHPKARCVYFPDGDFYQVCVEYKPIGREHRHLSRYTIFEAISEAIRILTPSEGGLDSPGKQGAF